MPIIYMDSVTDGMLRGLGQQMYSMRYNILDSLISVILVYFLLPKYAVAGYIVMIYFTDIFNFTLSVRRLRIVTKIKIPVKKVVMSVLSALSSVNIAILMLRNIGLPLSSNGLILTVHLLSSGVIYLILLLLFGCVGRREITWLKSVMDIK